MATELLTSTDFYFLNQNFEAVYKLTQFESLMWVDKYDEPGSFEIYAPPLPEIKAAALKDNYFITTKSDKMMIVEELETTVSPENGERLVIKGRSLESILDRRVIFLKCYFRDNIPDPDPDEGEYGSDNLEDAVRQLLDYCFIHPTYKDDQDVEHPDTDREMPLVFQYSNDDTPLTDEHGAAIIDENSQPILADSLNSEDISNINLKDCEFDKGTDCLEIVNTIVKTRGLGYTITRRSDNKFVFRLIKGKKRTSDQFNNPMVIFAPKFNNIKNTKFTDSHGANYKNFVYTEGETYKSRKPTIVKTGEATGLLRREVYVVSEVTHETEASNVTHDGITKDKKKLSEDEYQTALAKDAEKYFRKYQGKVKCESEVEPRLTFQYGRDFGIGDILEVQDGTGNSGKVRCTEFIISYSESGYEEYPTFENYTEEDDEPAQSTASGGNYTDGEDKGGGASYDAMTSAELSAGVSTEERVMTADQTKAGIQALLLEMCYPVGSVYMSSQNVSPQSFLGGTWTRVKDRFILAAGDTYVPGATGGSATVKLDDVKYMPSHNHNQRALTGYFAHTDSAYCTYNGYTGGIVSGAVNRANKIYALGRMNVSNNWYDTVNINATHTHDSQGSATAHENMPPYKVYYCWERTA